MTQQGEILEKYNAARLFFTGAQLQITRMASAVIEFSRRRMRQIEKTIFLCPTRKVQITWRCFTIRLFDRHTTSFKWKLPMHEVRCFEWFGKNSATTTTRISLPTFPFAAKTSPTRVINFLASIELEGNLLLLLKFSYTKELKNPHTLVKISDLSVSHFARHDFIERL